ncbi:MAG: DNA gyrase C-terminal beta-propeller domain-containing protein, partial [Alphaproteobacteria bacterium]|nr:DNA gyrase C-terminal beta-propeller domain-containing protein [Alphaproteobacteria bacterium]
EKEPITIVCSQKGWVRSLKGHLSDFSDIKYKEGDGPKFAVHAQTTDKLLVFSTNGRFYTLGADKLPGGRGHGEPLRLMVDLGNEDDIVQLLIYNENRKLLVASTDGRGFVVNEADVVAQTRNGKQVLNVGTGVVAKICVPVHGDHVAVIGQNRKLLVFPVSEMPEMTRGKGVIIQKYKDGGISDIKVFKQEDGLTWASGDRTRTVTDLVNWYGKRAQTGKMPPPGFPRNNKFT